MIIVGINFPEAILVSSIMLLTATFSYEVFNISALPSLTFMHKALILAGAGFYTLKNGVKKKITYFPLAVILLCLLFSFTFSSRLTNYKTMDLITAFFGFFIGWFIFYIDWKQKLKYIFYISLMPIISLINGCILYFFKLWNPIQYIDTYRLQGGNIPPHLAMLGLVGMTAALTLYYKGKKNLKKLYLIIAFADFVIIMATVTRGAIIGAIIIISFFILDYIKESIKKHDYLTFETIIVLVIFTLIVLIFASQIILRSINGGGGLNTSGRFEAWNYYLNAGKANRVFGIGLGAIKTIEGVDVNNSFTAAHNEYLRFFVETGAVGFVLIFSSFIAIFYKLMKNNILGNKKFLLMAFIAAFVVFSATDNTISAVQFWVPFCWYLGLVYENNSEEMKL
jgi:O-antigen ligase